MLSSHDAAIPEKHQGENTWQKRGEYYVPHYINADSHIHKVEFVKMSILKQKKR